MRAPGWFHCHSLADHHTQTAAACNIEGIKKKNLNGIIQQTFKYCDIKIKLEWIFCIDEYA